MFQPLNIKSMKLLLGINKAYKLIIFFMLLVLTTRNSTAQNCFPASLPFNPVTYCGPQTIIDKCNPNRIELYVDVKVRFKKNNTDNNDQSYTYLYKYSLNDNQKRESLLLNTIPVTPDGFTSLVASPNQNLNNNNNYIPQTIELNAGNPICNKTNYLVKDLNTFKLNFILDIPIITLMRKAQILEHRCSGFGGHFVKKGKRVGSYSYFGLPCKTTLSTDFLLKDIQECKDTTLVMSYSDFNNLGFVNEDDLHLSGRPCRWQKTDEKTHLGEWGLVYEITIHWKKLANEPTKIIVNHPFQQELNLCVNEYPYVFRGANPEFESCSWIVPTTSPIIENTLAECLYIEEPAQVGSSIEIKYNCGAGTEDCENNMPITVKTIQEPSLKIEPGRDTLICRGNTITFAVPDSQLDYKWYKIHKFYTDDCGREFADKDCISKADSFLVVSEPGLYMVEILSKNGCLVYDTIEVFGSKIPSVKINASTNSICTLGNNQTSANLSIINIQNYDNTSFHWSTGATTTSINAPTANTYTLQAKDNNGCLSSDEIKIEEDGCAGLYNGQEGHSIVKQLNIALYDNSDASTKTIILNDNQTINSGDVVKTTCFVKLNYHRSGHSDVASINGKFVMHYTLNGVPGSLTIADYNTNVNKVYQAINKYDVTSGNTISTFVITGVDTYTGDVRTADLPIPNIANDINVELELKKYIVPAINSNIEVDQIDKIIDDVASNKKLTVTWKPIPQALEYELQWAFVDAAARENISDEDVLNERGISIVTSENYYTLDLAYPIGKLYYRIRPVGRFTTGTKENYEHIRNGKWSDPISYDIDNANAFETDKSWQRTSTFAEEGKKKDVISYYDQFLRTAQVVTNLNTEKLSLTAETFYDYEGRPVLNVLPVPLTDNNLKFKPGLNNVNGHLLSKDDFDHGTQPALDNTSGVSKYYSSNNTDFLASNKFYANTNKIPNADGYVTTQIQYKRDATGRVVKQSGVGEEFSLDIPDSDGFTPKHYTQYFYSSVPDNELIRLFGSNTGKSKHYKKNYVVDPNDQISVSYVDMFGRTVATCLAGRKPDNLQPIDSDTGLYIMPLHNNNIYDYDAHTVSLNYVFGNTIKEINNRDTFEYSLDGWVNQTEPENPIQLCQTCEYKLTIKVVDPRGFLVHLSELSPPQDNVHFINDNTQIEAIYGKDVLCQTPPIHYPAIVFDAPVNKIGEYTVIKTLEILTDPIDSLDINTVNGVVSFDHFKDSLLHNFLDSTACDFGCSQYVFRFLKDSLSAVPNAQNPFVLDTINNTTHRDLFRTYYNKWCNAINIFQADSSRLAQESCESIYEQIKSAVSPGGLYFTGAFIRQYKSLILSLQDITGTPAQVLAAVKARWTRYYADSFAIYHPEYCHYLECISDSTDNRLTANMSLVFTWSEAEARGYTNRTFYQTYDNYEYPPSDPTEGCTNPSLYSLYEDSLNNFFQVIIHDRVNDNPYLSLFDFVDWKYTNYHNYNVQFPYNISPGNEATILQQYNPQTFLYPEIDFTNYVPNQPPLYGLTQADINKLDTLKWYHFRDLLSSVKERAKAIALEKPGCAAYQACRYLPDDSALVHYPIHDRGHMATDNEADSMIAEICRQTCKGFADNYYPRLIAYCHNGTLNNPADSLELKRLLTKYCSESCGIDNPIGLFKPEDTSGNKIDSIRIFLANHSFTCSWDSIVNYNVPIKYQYVIDTITGDTITGTVCTPDGIEALLAFVDKTRLSYNYPDDTAGTTIVSQTLQQWGVDTSRIIFKDDHITFVKGQNGDCNNAPCVSTFYFLDSAGNKIHNIKDIYWSERRYDSPLGASALYQFYANKIIPYYTQYFAVVITNDGGILKYHSGYLYMLNYNWQGSGCSLDFKGKCVKKPVQIWALTSAMDSILMPVPDSCLRDLTERAINNLKDLYNEYIDSVKLDIYKAYIDNCFKLKENFIMKYKLNEYQYTLYYYDQAGNLVQTVPPEGVFPLSPTQIATGTYDAHGIWTGIQPDHVLKTQYRYNTRNQVIWQNTPDADSTRFWYNQKGQLVLSQNAKQKPDDKFSFTFYDHLGRILVVGEVDSSIAHFYGGMKGIVDSTRFPLDELYNPSESVGQLTLTRYDNPETIVFEQPNDFKQQNLRNRVSATYYADKFINNSQILELAQTNSRTIVLKPSVTTNLQGNVTLTAYSYDEVGNVKSLVQQIQTQQLNVPAPPNPENLTKRIDYTYDLVSGKVNKVIYQPNQQDMFVHRYEYDADNRITDVYTSRDGIVEYHEAKYFYYPHGPLARIEIGNDKVQGVDYYYTLQGWLKGINSSNPSASDDAGKDANNVFITSNNDTLNKYIPKDQFNLLLAYFKNDYTPVVPPSGGGGGGSIFDNNTVMPFYEGISNAKFKGLYNGNIAMMATGLPVLGTTPADHWMVDEYTYDQLNRITVSYTTNPTGTTAYNHTLSTSYEYDKNGNILGLNRRAFLPNNTVALMDSLKYNYTHASGKLKNNKLNYVDDIQTDAALFKEDIDDQASGNYTYDAIGQLTKDNAEHIEDIEWNVYGKIKKITFNNGKPGIEFRYDATGNRVAKLLTNAKLPVTEEDTIYTATYYWRDAQGNILSTESRRFNDLPGTEPPIAASVNHAIEVEYNIYGSSRIGTMQDTIRYDFPTLNTYGMYARYMARRQYELSNHLGNVMATFSDDKTFNSTTEQYETAVLSAQNYYPFGMQIPGKTFNLPIYSSLNNYRFGFNGQERETELGTSFTTAEYWMYDGRLGRRWNRDPKPYPFVSQYATFLNNPISYSDPFGDVVNAEFRDKDGNCTEQIPEQIQETFNKEYGIKLGYDADCGQLYYAGDVSTDQQVSSIARDAWITELSSDCESNTNLYSGYNIGLTWDTKIDGYEYNTGVNVPINLGMHFSSNNTVYMDLADFDGTAPKGFSYIDKTANIPERSFNFARILEHEFLGHGVLGLKDKPATVLPPYAGPVEEIIVNPIREQIGVPKRLTYIQTTKRGIGLTFGETKINYGFTKPVLDIDKSKSQYLDFDENNVNGISNYIHFFILPKK